MSGSLQRPGPNTPRTAEEAGVGTGLRDRRFNGGGSWGGYGIKDQVNKRSDMNKPRQTLGPCSYFLRFSPGEGLRKAQPCKRAGIYILNTVVFGPTYTTTKTRTHTICLITTRDAAVQSIVLQPHRHITQVQNNNGRYCT